MRDDVDQERQLVIHGLELHLSVVMKVHNARLQGTHHHQQTIELLARVSYPRNLVQLVDRGIVRQLVLQKVLEEPLVLDEPLLKKPELPFYLG
jgi:hypothetical protein